MRLSTVDVNLKKIVVKLSSSLGISLNCLEISYEDRMDNKKRVVALVFNYDCKCIFGDFNLG